MRSTRRALTAPVARLEPGHRRVWTLLVESLVALLVLGALLGLGVGLALTRTVDFLLFSG